MQVELSKAEVLTMIKGTLAINDEDIKLFSEFTKSFNRKDASSKDVYIIMNRLYREHEGKSVALALGKLFNVIANDNNAIIDRLKAISRLAKSSVELKVILNLEQCFFYNIEAAIKLFEAINKSNKPTKEEDLKACRKAIKSANKEDISMSSYNNQVANEIKALRKMYGIVDIDGVAVVTNIKSKIDKLSDSEKLELLNYLQSKVSNQSVAVAWVYRVPYEVSY